MEFFQIINHLKTDTEKLKSLLTISCLPELCDSIDTVTPDNAHQADIYCLWGEFSVIRDEIRNGVRFSLVNCPHALAWTITHHEEAENIVIHCTIDDVETDEDFADSIELFIKAWSTGIARLYQ